MKYLRSVKARGLLDAKDARLAYGIPSQKAGQPYKDNWDVERAVREAMLKVIPIFRAVHAIADNQARLPIETREGSEKGEVIEDHPLVRLLNQEPNPDESPYSFRYRLSAQVLLSRKGAFVERVRDRSGEIRYLYLLNPVKTNPVVSPEMARRMARGRDAARLVSEFEVDLGQGEKERIPAEDVAWIKLPHPLDPLTGMTPLEAAGLTIDIDVLARLYNRTFLQNDGRPGGIVGVQGEMDDDVADELETRFNVGTRGVGRVTVIEADGLDWVDTAVTPRDAQYVEALAGTKVDLLGAFGVPESVAYANASGRTWDNADAELGIFWISTMLGHLGLIGDGLNKIDGEPETYTHFDTSEVEPLQRAEIARRKEMREEVEKGTRTLDSYLEETGRPPVGSAEARSYFRAMGEIPYATEGEATPALSLVQETAQAAAKAVFAEYERKQSEGVVTPFRYSPRSGASG